MPEPFAPEWRIAPATWAEIAAGQDTGGLRGVFFRGLSQSAHPSRLPELSPGDQESITQMGDLEQAIAVSLDKAVNGTSLMLVLKIGQAYLLFPGDAQWGTWQAALRNPTANALLRKTTFFKVSHHGSHNGTPREFVEGHHARPGRVVYGVHRPRRAMAGDPESGVARRSRWPWLHLRS